MSDDIISLPDGLFYEISVAMAAKCQRRRLRVRQFSRLMWYRDRDIFTAILTVDFQHQKKAIVVCLYETISLGS